jgi:protein TonB
MIAASKKVKIVALATAIGLHGAFASALMSRSEIEVEGSGGAQEARLGTSFADIAVGTLEAVQNNDVAEPTEPDTSKTVDVTEPQETTAPPKVTEVAQPTETPQIQEIESAPQVELLATDAVPTISALAPIPTPTLTPDAVQKDVIVPEVAQPTTPEPAQEVVTAFENPSPAITRSLLPQRRSEAFEQAHKAPPPKQKAKKKPRKAPAKAARGNSVQNATAGSATGSSTATATTSGNAAGNSNASGNAAASNYPGQVMRKISRVSRPRSNSKGTAVVGFSVTDTGGLGRVYLASSSGSAQLDSAAMRIIQRAAPFPAPPPGARHSFTISIKGR